MLQGCCSYWERQPCQAAAACHSLVFRQRAHGTSTALLILPFCPSLPCTPPCCLHTLLAADFGQEKAVSVQGLDAAAVQNKLKELISAFRV